MGNDSRLRSVGDVPTPGLLVGSAIVVASGLYILWRETLRRRRRSLRHSERSPTWRVAKSSADRDASLTLRWREKDSNPRSPVGDSIFRDCPVRAFGKRPDGSGVVAIVEQGALMRGYR